ncbi:MAG: leucine-rich repeat domain-containing protein [Robinsoniella sp.]|nr:leucine-rich repeat domain-containing protein [Robinsoniella sp.]
MMNQLSVKNFNAFDGKKNSVLYWNLEEDGTLVVKGMGRMQDYYKKERPWESVCDSIKMAVFEKGVTGIGGAAFKNCRNLRSIQLSRDIEIIHYGAFENCCCLENVEIPKRREMVHVYSPCGEGFQIMKGEQRPTKLCSRAKERKMERVETLTVERAAFRNTPWAEKTWGEFLVDDNTLVEYYGSRQEIIIPEYIEAIGMFAFKDLPITSVVLPKNLKKIEFGAFEHTRISKIIIPEAVTSVRKFAFTGIENPLHITFECDWPRLDEEFVDGKNVYLQAHYDSEIRKYAWGHRIVFMDREEASEKAEEQEEKVAKKQASEKIRKRREFSRHMWKVDFDRIERWEEYWLRKLKSGYVFYSIGFDEKCEKAEEVEIFAGRYLHKDEKPAKMTTLFGGAYHIFYQRRKLKDYPGLQEQTETSAETQNGAEMVSRLMCWRNKSWKRWIHSEEYTKAHDGHHHVWYVTRSKYAEDQIGEYRFLKLWKEGGLIERDQKALQESSKPKSEEMLMDEEILRRMKILKLDASVKKAFKKSGVIYKEKSGVLCELEKRDQEDIRFWEEMTGCKVYYAMENFTNFGHLFTMLYVSEDCEKWKGDRIDLRCRYAIAYCVNRTDNIMTDVGYVRLASINRIVTRIG